MVGWMEFPFTELRERDCGVGVELGGNKDEWAFKHVEFEAPLGFIQMEKCIRFDKPKAAAGIGSFGWT